MSLFSPVDMSEILSSGVVEKDIERDMFTHMNMINAKSYFPQHKTEEILMRQQQFQLMRLKKENRFSTPKGLPVFRPSSASKSKRELYYRAMGYPRDEETTMPYNNRWTRNSTFIHDAVQRDLLYANELLDNPMFTVQMMDKGEYGMLPAWEQTVQNYKVIQHRGVEFVISGMMDGILTYNKTGESIGFEYKTRSNDAWQVHNMKQPSPWHIAQCTAYSLLFETAEGEPLTDYLLTYEGVAKDKWQAGATALRDVKAFHVKISERRRQNMLNRFADVVDAIEAEELPKPEPSRCFFCQYKSQCGGGC